MSVRVRTLPLHLGCCPDGPRCVLCSPREQVDTLDVATVLLDAHDGPVHVFGGPPPCDALLDLIGDRPLRVRVRPDTLDRATARGLVDRGVRRVELDALTPNNRVLKWTNRLYRGALVVEMLQTLRSWGVQTSVVQGIGLPGSEREDAARDAREFAPLVDVVRIHPVLVLEDAGLHAQHLSGRYQALDIQNAAEMVADALDVYDSAGVPVIRVGAQPGPDGLGRAVAGPVHPSLRETVESQRTLGRLMSLCDGMPAGARVVIECAPADLARTKGPSNHNVRVLRDSHGLASVQVRPDPALERGHNRVRRTTS